MSYQIGNAALGVTFVGDLGSLQRSLDQAGGAVDQFGRRSTSAMRGVASEANRADDAMRDLSDGIKAAFLGGGVTSGLVSLKNSIMGISGALAGALSVREYAQAADAVTLLQNRLKLATGSAQAAAAAYGQLFEVAQRSRVSFIELGSTYATIARSTKELGLTQGQLMTVTEAIGNAMTISGGSAESMNAALVQLGQGLGSGTLRGEELNSVMEQTPRLAQAIADGLGITIGQLRQYAEDGKLSAEAVTRALQSQATVLAGEVKGATLTVSQAMTQLNNSTVKTVGEIDRATGISAAMAGALQGLGSAVSGVGNAFTQHETAILTGMGMLAGAGTLAGLGAVSAAMGGVAGAIGLVKAAFVGLSVAAAANPIGLALLGIGAAVGGFVAYNSAVADSAEGLERRIYTLQERIKAGPSIYARDAEGMAQWQARVREMNAEVAALNRQLAEKRGPQIIGSVGSGDAALARAQRAEWDKAAGVRAEYLAGARTAGQKLQDELDRASKAFAGVLPPEVEKSIRERFAKPVSSAAKSAADEFARLRNQLSGSVADGFAEAQAAQQGLNTAQTEFLKLAGSPVWDSLSNTQRADLALLYERRIAQEQMAGSLKTSASAAEALARAEDAHIKTYTDAAGKATTRLEELRNEAQAMAYAEAHHVSLAVAIEETALARLREAQAAEMAKGTGMNDSVVLALQQEIDARRQIIAALAGKEQREAGQKLRENEAAEWQRTWDQISQSFTDALMEGGKSVAEYLKGLFRTLVLRPILAPIGTGLASLIMPGAASAGQGGGVLGGLGQLGSTISNLGNLLNGSSISAQLSGGFLRSADWLATSSNNTLAGIGEWMQGNQWLGSAMGALGNGFAGYGISKTLSGGYSTGLPVNEIAAIASMIPGIGPIAGVVGGLVNRAFGRKLKDTGLEGTFSGMDGLSANTYQFYKGGWFRSDKTKRSALDEDVRSGLAGQYAAMTSGNAAMAQALGLSTDGLAAFRSSFKFSTNGMSEEQVSQRLAEEFAKMADAQALLLMGTEKYVREGETAAGALTRLSTSLTSVNQVLDTLGLQAYATSLAGGDMASSLADLFGGLNAFAQASTSYYQAFYSDAERTATTTRQLTAALGQLGLQLPDTRDGYRALVEAQDRTTEAGRSTYATLLQLAPAFADLTQAMQQLGKGVQDEVQRLRSLLTGDSSTSLAALQAQFVTGTAMARAGDADALARLPELSQAIEAAAALQAVTAADVALMRGQLAASLGETLGMLGLNVPAFEVGTNYVPRTMLAQIHEGEAIVPRAYNPAAGGTAPGSEALARRVEALVTELQGLRAEVRSGVNHSAKTARILDRVARDGDAFVTVAQA